MLESPPLKAYTRIRGWHCRLSNSATAVTLRKQIMKCFGSARGIKVSFSSRPRPNDAAVRQEQTGGKDGESQVMYKKRKKEGRCRTRRKDWRLSKLDGREEEEKEEEEEEVEGGRATKRDHALTRW